MFPFSRTLHAGRDLLPSAIGNCLAIFIVIAAALPRPLQAADAPLTVGEAQQLAVMRSRQLAAQDSAAAASLDMAVAARQLPDPVLKLGVDNLPVTGPDRLSLNNDFMTMRRVGVSQELTSSDKRRLRAERFEREADTASAQKAKLTAEIERDTALAWLDRFYLEAMETVIAAQREQARLAVDAAEGAYRGGRGTQADVFAAKSALGMIDDRASEVGRRARNAAVRLSRWIGDTAARPLAARPDIDRVRHELDSLDAGSLNAHLTQHPDIAVLSRQEQVAQAQAQLAKANEKADWAVEVSYQRRAAAFSDMVSVGLSIPLQWNRKNLQDRELAASLAAVDQARDERDEMLRAHVAETRMLINEWQDDRQRRQRFERELVPLAAERTSAALAAYRGGKASLADTLAARRDELEVRLQALQLEAEIARLWAQLNFLYPSTAIATPPASKDNK